VDACHVRFTTILPPAAFSPECQDPMRALQFAQDRLATGGSRSIRRPLPLTIVMWFSGIYAIGAAVGIAVVALDVASPSMGGMPVSREFWLQLAAPLIGGIAVLMALTSLGLRRHRPWSRWTCICIWPLIAMTAIGAASQDMIPWWLARQALIDAAVVGAIATWLLFRYRESVLYFYRVRQARGGSVFRR
jgi:hypothetical protein